MDVFISKRPQYAWPFFFFNSTTIVFGKNNPTDTPGYSSDLAVRISSSGLHARLGSFLSVVLKEIVYDSI